MSDRKNVILRPGQGPIIGSGHGNLLDAALGDLTKEQRERLIEKALEKRLELDAAARAADQRHHSSSIDMDRTIQGIEAIEASTKSDYTIQAKYETASGHTSVNIKKSNTTVIIVVAVAIAVIFLIVFAN